VKYEFRWNQWNIEHIAEHGVSAADAEFVIRNAKNPFPQAQGNGKFLVWGQNSAGRYLQVIYIFSPDDVTFVVHARPLTDSDKRKFRRRTR